AFKQRIECMEEFFLGAFLAGEKLNIVDQQCIDTAVKTLEVIDCIELQRLDHVCHKAFRTQVYHSGIFPPSRQRIAYCMHHVRLAETNSTMEEQWVIGPSRIL